MLPVLIHGDASFSGQGIIQETLNLAQTRGYGTGGTVHIVVNNQIGFTTSDPRDARSTLYCTDVAKMLEVPIFHVNGDDPEAVCLVTEIALDYRMQFHRDVVSTWCAIAGSDTTSRTSRWSRSRSCTSASRSFPTTRKLYAEKLVNEGVITEAEAEEMIATFRKALDGGYHTNKTILSNYKPPFEIDWSRYKGSKWNERDDTRLPLETLKKLAERITTVPENFKLHPRVQKIMEDRRVMARGELRAIRNGTSSHKHKKKKKKKRRCAEERGDRRSSPPSARRLRRRALPTLRLVRRAMTGGPFYSEEREDETDECEHLGQGEAQERERAQDAVGLRLTGHAVDVRSEDQADTDTGADRREREDQRATERQGRGGFRSCSCDHEMYRFPFGVGRYAVSTRRVRVTQCSSDAASWM